MCETQLQQWKFEINIFFEFLLRFNKTAINFKFIIS